MIKSHPCLPVHAHQSYSQQCSGGESADDPNIVQLVYHQTVVSLKQKIFNLLCHQNVLSPELHCVTSLL